MRQVLEQVVAKLLYLAQSGVLQVGIITANLSNERCDMVQAVQYYNSCIYPDYAMHELVRNPSVNPMPLEILHHFPAAICHSLVLLALGHRLHRMMPRGADPNTLIEMRSKLYYHRGVAIRALSEDLADERIRNSEMTICSILEFLIIDMSYTSLDWRQHFAGVLEIIAARGGIKHLFDTRPHLQMSLFLLMMVGIIGCTTTPPSEMTPAISQLYPIENISAMYSDSLFPSHPCPHNLFLEIAKVNQIRLSPVNKSTRVAAEGALKRINDFLPEKWASSKDENEEGWLVIGRVYKSAVAIYCIASLQNLSVLPKTTKLQNMRSAHANRLFQLLPKAFASPMTKRCVVWPTVVAGMEAVHSSQDTRTFIANQLFEMSGDMGTFTPVAARSLLQRFWDSGKTGWDDCFDGACVFG